MYWFEDPDVKEHCKSNATLSKYIYKKIPDCSLFYYIDTENDGKMFFGATVPHSCPVYDCCTFYFMTECGLEHTCMNWSEELMDTLFYDIFFRKNDKGEFVTKIIKTYDNTLDVLEALRIACRDGLDILKEI